MELGAGLAGIKIIYLKNRTGKEYIIIPLSEYFSAKQNLKRPAYLFYLKREELNTAKILIVPIDKMESKDNLRIYSRQALIYLKNHRKTLAGSSIDLVKLIQTIEVKN